MPKPRRRSVAPRAPCPGACTWRRSGCAPDWKMAMTELTRLKQALDEERVAPRPEAKEAAIAAALAAFDARNEGARQGSGFSARLRIAAGAAFDILTGRKPMTRTHALAGGVSLAALMLAVVTTANLQNIDGFRPRGTDTLVGREGPVLDDMTEAPTPTEEARQDRSAAPKTALRREQLAEAESADEADMPVADEYYMPAEEYDAASQLAAAPPAGMADAAGRAASAPMLAEPSAGFAPDALPP